MKLLNKIKSLRGPARLRSLLPLIVLIGVGWYLLFRFTPMRYLLPARLDSSLREEYVRLALTVDSLSAAAELNSRYISNIESIITDSITIAEPDTTSTNLYDLPLDSLMAAGKAEERFVRQYESSERFNLSVLSPIAAEGMVFYPPVSGVSLKSNAADTEMPSVTINAGATTPVSAVYRGTVIDSYYTSTKGITLVIQHPNNFISQYGGLGDVFVARGAKVNAGQRIGMAADERYPLTFMLWHDGTPLDPSEYIQLPKSESVMVNEPFAPAKKKRYR